MLIYKILRADEWASLQAEGQTAGAPVDIADGFVHFSTAAQLATTLEKHFPDERDLTLLACDSQVMGDDIRWEPSRGGDLFPHLYRPFRMSDILWSRQITYSNGVHDTGPLE